MVFWLRPWPAGAEVLHGTSLDRLIEQMPAHFVPFIVHPMAHSWHVG